MKLISFLLLFFGISAFAYHAELNCTTNSITPVYTASIYQVPLGPIPSNQNHMSIWSTATVRICVNVGQIASVIPSNGSPYEHCIPAAVNSVPAYASWNFVPIQNYVFTRADSGNVASCLTGIIDYDVW